MLQRAGGAPRPLLGAARLASLGGHILETIGRARVRFGRDPDIVDRAGWLQQSCARFCAPTPSLPVRPSSLSVPRRIRRADKRRSPREPRSTSTSHLT